MGSTEAIPKNKFVSSIKTSDKVFSTDKSKVPCDRDTTDRSASVDSGIERFGDLDETTTTENTTLTDSDNPKPSTPTSPTIENR